MKKFSDFFVEAPDNTIMSVDRDDQNVYRNPKPPRQPLQIPRPSGYRDTPAGFETPLRDLETDPGSPPAQYGDMFGDVVDRETVTDEEQKELQRARMVGRLGLEDRFGADHPMRDKLGSSTFVSAMENPRVLDHFMDIDKIKQSGNPMRTVDSRFRPNPRTMDRFYPRMNPETPSLWDQLELDNEENFDDYVRAVTKLIGDDDTIPSEVGVQPTNKAYNYQYRSNQPDYGGDEPGQGLNTRYKRTLPIEGSPELLQKYFSALSPREIADLPDGLDFSNPDTLEFIKSLKRGEMTPDDFNEFGDMLGMSSSDLRGGVHNMNKAVGVAGLLNRLSKSEDEGAQSFIGGLRSLNNAESFEDIDKALADGSILPDTEDMLKMINDDSKNFAEKYRGLPWSEKPLVGNNNLDILGAGIANKVDDLLFINNDSLDFGNYDEGPGKFTPGKHHAFMSNYITMKALFGGNDTIDRLDPDDVADYLPALVMARMAADDENNISTMSDLNDIYDAVVEDIEALFSEDYNEVYNEYNDETLYAIEPSDFFSSLATHIETDIANGEVNRDTWNNVLGELIMQRDDRYSDLEDEARPVGTRDYGARGDFTSIQADFDDHWDTHNVSNVETLDDDLKAAGLSRDELVGSTYIAWNNRGNPDVAARKFEKKFGKAPDRQSKEFDNFQKRLAIFDVMKTWKDEVLPQLPPGTIVYNTPVEDEEGRGMRAALYAKLGFGRESAGGDQYGVVGNDGKVHPIDPLSEESLGRQAKERQEIRGKRRAKQKEKEEAERRQARQERMTQLRNPRRNVARPRDPNGVAARMAAAADRLGREQRNEEFSPLQVYQTRLK